MDCQRESTLWRIFRGCGHSFHLECNLPEVSVCHLCKSLLQSEVMTLGKTANEAVTKFIKETVEEASDVDEETSDDENEASDDEDNEALADQSSGDEHSKIANLISMITSWTNVQPPKH